MIRPQTTPPVRPQDLDIPGGEAAIQPAPRFRAPAYRATGKLRTKVALITGGVSGAGRAVACLFAREGSKVAITYRKHQQHAAEHTRDSILETTSSEIQQDDILLVPGDVTNPRFARDAVSAVIEKYQRLDILINNAVYQQPQDRIEDISEEQWDRTFQTNIYGYYRMVKAALPFMKRGGCIINTGSITGCEGGARLLDCAATEGAIHAFTKSLAQNLASRGIRVNCVAPGPARTPAERRDAEIRGFGENPADARPARPEEVAPLYVYFATD